MRTTISKNQTKQIPSKQGRAATPPAINILLEDFFDQTPLDVLKETLQHSAVAYSTGHCEKMDSKAHPFRTENAIYQLGLIEELLSKLSKINNKNVKGGALCA